MRSNWAAISQGVEATGGGHEVARGEGRLPFSSLFLHALSWCSVDETESRGEGATAYSTWHS